MNKKVYVCTGGCGAVISQEQYDAGLTKCGAEECANKGVDFEERFECDDCGDFYKPAESHAH